MTRNPTRQNIHKGRLLVIDADEAMRTSVEALFLAQGYAVFCRSSWPEGRLLLQQEEFDLVLSDLQAGQGEGEGTVKTLLALGGSAVLVIAVPLARIEEGRAALRHGAAAYLLQPYDVGELQTLIDRSLFRNEETESHRRLERENRELRASQEVCRICLPLLQVDDLDRLGDLFLDTLMELCSAEAGILWLSGAGRPDLHLHSRRGLLPISLAGSELPATPSDGLDPPSPSAILSPDFRTIDLPLTVSGRRIGLARLESPAGREAFSDDDLQRADRAGAFAGVALFALLRRQEIEHNLLRAPGSQAYNMTFFRDHLEKKLFSAKRYDRRLALLKVVIDNYAELSARFLDRQVNAAVEKMVATILTVLRDADLICALLPGQFYLLLPETDAWGALMAQRRMRKALLGQLVVSDLKKNLLMHVQMRAVTAPLDGATLLELDQLLETRLARLRGSLLFRSKLEGGSFWKIVTTLLAPEGKKLLHREDEGNTALISFSAGGLAPFCLAVAQEILGTLPVRGVILWGSDDLTLPRSILAPLFSADDSKTALYLFGAGDGADSAGPQVGVTIPVADTLLQEHAFLLALGEDYAYALLARRVDSGWQAFHTNDGYFVENMLAKLQEQYQFQAQI